MGMGKAVTISSEVVEMVGKMCRIPASGSPIVLGVVVPDDTAFYIDQVMARVERQWRVRGWNEEDSYDDKMITVIRGLPNDYESCYKLWEQFEKLRFRNQVVVLLDAYHVYPTYLLNRLVVLGNKTETTPPMAPAPQLKVVEKPATDNVVNILDAIHRPTAPVVPATPIKLPRHYTTIQTSEQDARWFIQDVMAAHNLTTTVQSGNIGPSTTIFHKKDGSVDDRFEVTHYVDGKTASIMMIIGE